MTTLPDHVQQRMRAAMMAKWPAAALAAYHAASARYAATGVTTPTAADTQPDELALLRQRINTALATCDVERLPDRRSTGERYRDAVHEAAHAIAAASMRAKSISATLQGWREGGDRSAAHVSFRADGIDAKAAAVIATCGPVAELLLLGTGDEAGRWDCDLRHVTEAGADHVGTIARAKDIITEHRAAIVELADVLNEQGEADHATITGIYNRHVKAKHDAHARRWQPYTALRQRAADAEAAGHWQLSERFNDAAALARHDIEAGRDVRADVLAMLDW